MKSIGPVRLKLILLKFHLVISESLSKTESPTSGWAFAGSLSDKPKHGNPTSRSKVLKTPVNPSSQYSTRPTTHPRGLSFRSQRQPQSWRNKSPSIYCPVNSLYTIPGICCGLIKKISRKKTTMIWSGHRKTMLFEHITCNYQKWVMRRLRRKKNYELSWSRNAKILASEKASHIWPMPRHPSHLQSWSFLHSVRPFLNLFLKLTCISRQLIGS